MNSPGSIACVTCDRRLQVTDAGLRGTIVACPHCGSLVQIPGDAPIDAGGHGEKGDAGSIARRNAPPEALPAGRPLVIGQESIASDAMTEDSLAGPPPIEPAGATVAAAGSSWAESLPPDSPNAPDSSNAHARPAEQAARSGIAASRSSFRRWLGPVAIAVGSCVSIGLIVTWAWQSRSLRMTQRPTAAEPRAPQIDEANRNAAKKDRQENTSQAKQKSRSNAPDAQTDADAPGGTGSDDAEPMEKQPVQERPTNVSDGQPKVGENSPSNTTPEIPADLLPSNPLEASGTEESEGEGVSTDASNPVNEAPITIGKRDGADENNAADGESQSSMEDLPPELARFTELLDLPGNGPKDLPQAAPARDVEALRLDAAAEPVVDPMLMATPPHEIDVNSGMRLRVAIKTDGYPLADLALTFTQLSGVPVELDWAVLDIGGFPIRKKVTAPDPGTNPVGELLDSIVTDGGGELLRRDDHVLVTFNEATLAGRLKKVTTLDDLKEKVTIAPAAIDDLVQSAGAKGKDAIVLRALVVDSLRRLTGVPPRLDEAIVARWTRRIDPQSWQNEADLPPLWPIVAGGDSGEPLDTAMALPGWIARVARLNDASAVVHWPDVRRRKISPVQWVMSYTGQPAGEMLKDTLQPMALAARRGDAHHWWVGTDASYDRLMVVVRGEGGVFANPEATERLRQMASGADVPIAVWRHGEVDGGLIVLPRYLARQLPRVAAAVR